MCTISANAKSHAAIILAFFFVFAPVFGQEQADFDISERLIQLTEASAPEILSNETVLFTYVSDPTPRYVAAAFAHENYSTIHLFSKNANEVFILTYPIPPTNVLPSDQLTYRLVVDGLWQPDPQNSQTVRTPAGLRLSQFALERPEAPAMWGAVVRGRTVTFRLRITDLGLREEARSVYVVGSFNNYDPYFDPMEEVGDGIYERTVRVPRGEHFYYYVVDGAAYRDPQSGSAVVLNNDVPGTRISVGR